MREGQSGNSRWKEREMSMTHGRHMAVLAGGKPQQLQQHLLSSTAEGKNPMKEMHEVMNDHKSSSVLITALRSL